MEKFDDNKLFQFVYVSAMRDAVLQKAYEGEKKWAYYRRNFGSKE